MCFAHVIDKCFLVDCDFRGVHIWDDWAQHLSQGNELGLGDRGHLNRRQVTWNTHIHTHKQIIEWNRWECCSAHKHTWVREVSLFLTCAACENNSKYWSWHSSPNHLLNHDRGGLFMWVIWTMPDCFWNSISTGTDHGIPLLPQKWPQVCLLGRSDILPPHIIQPYMSRRCPRQAYYRKWEKLWGKKTEIVLEIFVFVKIVWNIQTNSGSLFDRSHIL